MSDRRAAAIDVVDNPNRRAEGALQESVDEHLAATSAEGAVIIEVEEKIVLFIDDDNRPSRHPTNRVRDKQRRNSVTSIGLSAWFIPLPAEAHRGADLRTMRLGISVLNLAGLAPPRSMLTSKAALERFSRLSADSGDA